MTAQTTTSFAELQQKAQAGDTQAQFDLALCYANGDGVEKDEVIAFEWLKQAAELGHVDAQFALGLFYFIDPFKPEADILRDNQHIIEFINTSFPFLKNLPNAQEFDPTTIKFDPAIRLASDLAVSGKFERSQSTNDLAFVWLNKAAEQNHAGAIYWLGVCYSKGYGTQQSDEIAFENLKRSAEVGYPDAYYSLALCYHEGKGCQQNYALAFKWIMKSVEYTDIYFKFPFGFSGSFAEHLAKSYLFWLFRILRSKFNI